MIEGKREAMKTKKYCAFIVTFIQKHFPHIDKIPDAKFNEPLTGPLIAMRANDVLTLYMLLCDLFKAEIILTSIDAFNSVETISKALLSYIDEEMLDLYAREN